MRALRSLTQSALALLVLVTPARADSARLTYERALARERALTTTSAPGLADLRQLSTSFEVVVRRFPTSGYADNALLKAGELAEQAYGRSGADADRMRAQQFYEWLAREYPASPLVKRARTAARALATEPAPAPKSRARPDRREVAPAPQVADRHPAAGDTTAAPARDVTTPAPPAQDGPVSAAGESPPSAPATASVVGVVQVRDVRRAVLPEVVRVTIELEGEVGYRQERLEGPPRIFFDLKGTAAAPGLQNAVLTWPDDVVRQVRFGRPAANTTRVVLDLEGTSRYSVFTLYNPFRLVVDFERAGGQRIGLQPSVPRPTIERDASTPGSVAPPAASPAAPEQAPTSSSRSSLDDIDLVPQPRRPKVDPAEIDGRDLSLDFEPVVASRAIEVLAGPQRSTGRSSSKAPSVLPQPGPAPSGTPVEAPRAPAANSNGTFSLARQLGLGISRIVIDPGHGGHDPGALGKGLNEADLVLDVALRLERLLLKQPGVEVVPTRRTDTFIALEERTALANREKADLFLSIHANASRNVKAQGVETYFLNFASTPDAEAVAARENSASARTMHNLSDIVKAIATNNKLDESRDVARLVQEALVTRLSGQHRHLRDLGVKQAPFVVLIGAAMPSVLAEISFLTNPHEMQLLKGNAYRERIAEALCDAVLRYRRSLKSVGTVAAQ